MADIGLIGLAVMGQNLALNIADKGFKISVYNRSYEKTEHTVCVYCFLNDWIFLFYYLNCV